MWTLTLKTLEENGLVARTLFASVPPRVDYAMTPLGHTVIEMSGVRTSIVSWPFTWRQVLEPGPLDTDASGRHGEVRICHSGRVRTHRDRETEFDVICDRRWILSG